VAVTSRFSIPYADPSDFVRDLPADMQALAVHLDGLLGRHTRHTAVAPSGTGVVTLNHGASFTPTKAFAQCGPPFSGQAQIAAQAIVGTITSSTVEVRLLQPSGAAYTLTGQATVFLVVYP
jgi:hypothetical protein